MNIKLNNVEISQEDLIKEITGNKELMATLQSKFGKQESWWFVPKEEAIYHYLISNGIGSSKNFKSMFDKDVLERQQVFRTIEEAEKADQQRMAKVRILKRIAEENAKDVWVCDWEDIEQTKCYFYYDYANKRMSNGSIDYCQLLETGFYMSKEAMVRIENELEKDYKIMLGVE